MVNFRYLSLALAFVLHPVASMAEDASQICSDIPSTEFNGAGQTSLEALQVAKGAGRVQFRTDDWGQPGHCPSDDARCRLSSYVVAGDVILATPTRKNGQVCAVYTAPDSGRITVDGYLPLKALVPYKGSLLETNGWAGTWHRSASSENSSPEEDQIIIKPLADGRYRLTGLAVGDKFTTAKNIRLGEFDIIDQPLNREFAFSIAPDGSARPYDEAPDATGTSRCRLRMWRVGPYMVVRDNVKCADGVRFTGAYRRRN